MARVEANGEGEACNGQVYMWGRGDGGRLGGAGGASQVARRSAVWAPALVPGLCRATWVSVSKWGRPHSMALVAPAAVSGVGV